MYIILKSSGKVKCLLSICQFFFSCFVLFARNIFRKEVRNSKMPYLQTKAVTVKTWIFSMNINITDINSKPRRVL